MAASALAEAPNALMSFSESGAERGRVASARAPLYRLLERGRRSRRLLGRALPATEADAELLDVHAAAPLLLATKSYDEGERGELGEMLYRGHLYRCATLTAARLGGRQTTSGRSASRASTKPRLTSSSLPSNARSSCSIETAWS